MFEFCATVGSDMSKEIASKEIALFNLFCSISGKFKQHKKSENVNFEETNYAVSILGGPATQPAGMLLSQTIACKLCIFLEPF